MAKDNGYLRIHAMMENIRRVREGGGDKIFSVMENREEERLEPNSENIIPIDNTTYPGVFQQQEESLSQKLPNVTFGETPFLLDRVKKTVTLKGMIQNLNLSFIMTTDTSNGGDGLYVTVKMLNLNDKTLQTLNVLYAHSEIFQKEWTVNEVDKKLHPSTVN
jgi:hypothetical protein